MIKEFQVSIKINIENDYKYGALPEKQPDASLTDADVVVDFSRSFSNDPVLVNGKPVKGKATTEAIMSEENATKYINDAIPLINKKLFHQDGRYNKLVEYAIRNSTMQGRFQSDFMSYQSALANNDPALYPYESDNKAFILIGEVLGSDTPTLEVEIKICQKLLRSEDYNNVQTAKFSLNKIKTTLENSENTSIDLSDFDDLFHFLGYSFQEIKTIKARIKKIASSNKEGLNKLINDFSAKFEKKVSTLQYTDVTSEKHQISFDINNKIADETLPTEFSIVKAGNTNPQHERMLLELDIAKYLSTTENHPDFYKKGLELSKNAKELVQRTDNEPHEQLQRLIAKLTKNLEAQKKKNESFSALSKTTVPNLTSSSTNISSSRDKKNFLPSTVIGIMNFLPPPLLNPNPSEKNESAKEINVYKKLNSEEIKKFTQETFLRNEQSEIEQGKYSTWSRDKNNISIEGTKIENAPVISNLNDYQEHADTLKQEIAQKLKLNIASEQLQKSLVEFIYDENDQGGILRKPIQNSASLLFEILSGTSYMLTSGNNYKALLTNDNTVETSSLNYYIVSKAFLKPVSTSADNKKNNDEIIARLSTVLNELEAETAQQTEVNGSLKALLTPNLSSETDNTIISDIAEIISDNNVDRERKITYARDRLEAKMKEDGYAEAFITSNCEIRLDDTQKPKAEITMIDYVIRDKNNKDKKINETIESKALVFEIINHFTSPERMNPNTKNAWDSKVEELFEKTKNRNFSSEEAWVIHRLANAIGKEMRVAESVLSEANQPGKSPVNQIAKAAAKNKLQLIVKTGPIDLPKNTKIQGFAITVRELFRGSEHREYTKSEYKIYGQTPPQIFFDSEAKYKEACTEKNENLDEVAAAAINKNDKEKEYGNYYKKFGPFKGLSDEQINSRLQYIAQGGKNTLHGTSWLLLAKDLPEEILTLYSEKPNEKAQDSLSIDASDNASDNASEIKRTADYNADIVSTGDPNKSFLNYDVHIEDKIKPDSEEIEPIESYVAFNIDENTDYNALLIFANNLVRNGGGFEIGGTPEKVYALFNKLEAAAIANGKQKNPIKLNDAFLRFIQVDPYEYIFNSISTLTDNDKVEKIFKFLEDNTNKNTYMEKRTGINRIAESFELENNAIENNDTLEKAITQAKKYYDIRNKLITKNPNLKLLTEVKNKTLIAFAQPFFRLNGFSWEFNPEFSLENLKELYPEPKLRVLAAMGIQKAAEEKGVVLDNKVFKMQAGDLENYKGAISTLVLNDTLSIEEGYDLIIKNSTNKEADKASYARFLLAPANHKILNDRLVERLELEEGKPEEDRKIFQIINAKNEKNKAVLNKYAYAALVIINFLTLSLIPALKQKISDTEDFEQAEKVITTVNNKSIQLMAEMSLGTTITNKQDKDEQKKEREQIKTEEIIEGTAELKAEQEIIKNELRNEAKNERSVITPRQGGGNQ